MGEGLSDKSRKNVARVLVVVAVIIILLLIILISPLKDLLFPTRQEPAITLELLESPVLDLETDLYRFTVTAITIGNPEPEVQFSRNDGLGEVETNQTLILLGAGESYLLTAVALNEHGSTQASLELFAEMDLDADQDGEDDEEEADETEEEGDTEVEGDGGAGGNNPPRIEEIFFGSDNITEMVNSGEALPMRYEEGRHDFVVTAVDPDGDEISFTVSENHGHVSEISRVAVDSVAFEWLSPANSEGMMEGALDVQIEVTAEDPSGGSDVTVIKLALMPVLDGEGPVDFGEPVPTEMRFNVQANPDRSGFVTADGVVRTGTVIVGDNDANVQHKGYLTFVLTHFPDIASENINGAFIRFDNVNRSGHPESIGRLVDFKYFNYGPTLDRTDFAVGGSRFMVIGNDSFGSGATARGSLITEVRRAIDAGKTEIQIKIGLDQATNNNDQWDMFQFNPGLVFLVIDYEP